MLMVIYLDFLFFRLVLLAEQQLVEVLDAWFPSAVICPQYIEVPGKYEILCFSSISRFGHQDFQRLLCTTFVFHFQ